MSTPPGTICIVAWVVFSLLISGRLSASHEAIDWWMGDDYFFDAHAFALGYLIHNYVVAYSEYGMHASYRETIRGEADFCVMNNHIFRNG